MRPLKVVLLCLSTALASSYITLQLGSPPTDMPLATLYFPPKLVIEHAGEAVVWGGWRTRNEHVPHGDVAVEIRCHLQLKLCTEAVAGLLRHEEGEDLEAQTYLLNVSNWAPNKIEAAAVLDDCLIRQVTINPEANTAVLRWSPKPNCEGDSGHADLVGDPL